MNPLRLILPLVICGSPLAAQTPALDWKPAPSRIYDGRSITAESARLMVPERRGGSERMIAVGLIRLKSTAASPGDPIVFLMGGPGIPASVMLPIPPYYDLFDRLRSLGDVILVDQRGIGTSDPVLNCPQRDPLPADFLASRARMGDALKEVTRSCLDQWLGRGVDVAAYNTQESADDLESLRQAIGARRLNLLAFSYGSHLALSYARRHPNGLGRMVLQGVRGPDQSLKNPLLYQRGLERLTDLAGRDSVAGRLTPNLKATLATLLSRFEHSPQRVALIGRSGQPATLIIGREGLEFLVSSAPDDPRLPAMLALLERGDSTILAAMASAAWQSLGEVNLMARAVDCASSSSDSVRARVARDAGGTLLGDPAPNLVRSAEFCQVFGNIALPEEFRSPVRSTTPTLFISGELDVLAPPEDAAAIAAGFNHATSLLVANGRHELLTIPLVQSAVVDFIAGKDVAGRPLSADLPIWLSGEEAKAPLRRR